MSLRAFYTLSLLGNTFSATIAFVAKERVDSGLRRND